MMADQILERPGVSAPVSLRTLTGVVRPVLNMLLLVILLWVIAGLVWRLTGARLDIQPAPEMAALGYQGPTAQITASQDILTSFDPFTRALPDGPADTQTSSAPETRLKLSLFGVRSTSGRKGSAIIKLPTGRQSAFAVGDDILDGVELVSVYPRYVEIRRAGVLESLYLAGQKADKREGALSLITRPSASGNAPQPRSATAAEAPSPVAQAVVGPSTSSLTRETVADLMRSVNMTPKMEGRRISGWQVSERGALGLLSQFEMQDGDILLEVNGTPLTTAERLQEMREDLANASSLILVFERSGERLSRRFQLSE